jgi:hypothetical protein
MAMIRDGSGHITSQPQCSAAMAKVNDTWSTVCDRFTEQVLTGVGRSWLLRSCHTRLATCARSHHQRPGIFRSRDDVAPQHFPSLATAPAERGDSGGAVWVITIDSLRSSWPHESASSPLRS